MSGDLINFKHSPVRFRLVILFNFGIFNDDFDIFFINCMFPDMKDKECIYMVLNRIGLRGDALG